MSTILCVGGAAHGKRVEYIGRTPRIDGDRYVLNKVSHIDGKIREYYVEKTLRIMPRPTDRITEIEVCG